MVRRRNRHFRHAFRDRLNQRKPYDFHEMHDQFHRHHREFHRYHGYFRYGRVAFILFNVIILYLLFSWGGFKGIGLFVAALIAAKEMMSFLLLSRLEKRIFKPIEELKQGLDEIARGNYNIKINCTGPNDLGILIVSFNEMAQKLYESEKVKAEYEENRKALVANISHDLKTPITSIQGYIEALLDGTAKPLEHKHKYLKTIYQNTVYINKLIDDLLLFSKLDMQKLDFKFEKVSILAFMNDLMEEYEFNFAERKIHFQYTAKLDQDYLVHLDGKRFYQAINNVLHNAVHHGPENDLSIEVELSRQENDIAIGIKDNGPGIPREKLPFIFDRFYRIDTERTKDFVSTGLGLAIARELVEAHGGKITVSSVEKESTCFTIRLPILMNHESEVST
ncbi:HAMP domain-containing sensor histidine kinase [Desulforamulus ruminis]|uniref:sensor histidine kinase n=1 Tax=Desulforamulus ruminis TaxID=1564 RepID=UPI002FD974E9